MVNFIRWKSIFKQNTERYYSPLSPTANQKYSNAQLFNGCFTFRETLFKSESRASLLVRKYFVWYTTYKNVHWERSPSTQYQLCVTEELQCRSNKHSDIKKEIDNNTCQGRRFLEYKRHQYRIVSHLALHRPKEQIEWSREHW